ncbi:MAG: DNA-processing protein DprA [Thermodesulfobacteriota bacterium]
MPESNGTLRIIRQDDSLYPSVFKERLTDNSPGQLFVLGNLDLLQKTKLAIFCSKKCPGQKIIKAFDFARSLRDSQKAVISGFHSPIEKECLRILLRGQQPIIICPARSLEKMRVPADWREGLAEGWLLILSPFPVGRRRFTVELARQRNLLVTALSDEICFIHSDPGGRIEELRELVQQWKIPIITI